MRNNKTGFTLVELIVSMSIFSIIIVIAFYQFPYVIGSIKKASNQTSVINSSIDLKDEFTFNGRTVAFYNYDTLIENNGTQYDFENRFRSNLINLISNVLEDKYGMSSYNLQNPEVCTIPYLPDQIFSESERFLIEDEFDLGSCENNPNSPTFNNKYRILVVMNQKTLSVNLYFAYQSKLHRITTSLNNDLDNDDIIFYQPSSGEIHLHVYEEFRINRFTGNSYNFCDETKDQECVFSDFVRELKGPGTIYADIYKLTDETGEINFKTSYILRSIFSINN